MWQVWQQFERTATENRQLRLSLAEAQTALSLIQTELMQLKSHYEERHQQMCRFTLMPQQSSSKRNVGSLSLACYSEREAVFDLVDQQNRVHLQVELLQ